MDMYGAGDLWICIIVHVYVYDVCVCVCVWCIHIFIIKREIRTT